MIRCSPGVNFPRSCSDTRHKVAPQLEAHSHATKWLPQLMAHSHATKWPPQLIAHSHATKWPLQLAAHSHATKWLPVQAVSSPCGLGATTITVWIHPKNSVVVFKTFDKHVFGLKN